MQVTLPEMGESVTEGTIAKWLKQPGDQVREGEGLVEVTTDKVDAEVPAPASGTLVKILAEAGKTVAVGAALAEIAVGTDGDGAAKKAAAATPTSEKTSTIPSPASGGGQTAPAHAERPGRGASRENLIHAPGRLRDYARGQGRALDGGDVRSPRREPGAGGAWRAPRTRRRRAATGRQPHAAGPCDPRRRPPRLCRIPRSVRNGGRKSAHREAGGR